MLSYHICSNETAHAKAACIATHGRSTDETPQEVTTVSDCPHLPAVLAVPWERRGG